MILFVSVILLLMTVLWASSLVLLASGLRRGYVRVYGTFTRQESERAYWIVLSVIAASSVALGWLLIMLGPVFLEQFCNALCQALGHSMSDMDTV